MPVSSEGAVAPFALCSSRAAPSQSRADRRLLRHGARCPRLWRLLRGAHTAAHALMQQSSSTGGRGCRLPLKAAPKAHGAPCLALTQSAELSWRPILPFGGLCLSLKAVSDSTSFQLDDRPPGDLCSKSINFLLRAFSLGARALTFAILAPPGSTPSRSNQTLGPCAKCLTGGLYPLI